MSQDSGETPAVGEALAGLPDKALRDLPRVVNRLLGQTFVYQDKDADKDDYYFVHRHRPAVAAALELAGFEPAVGVTAQQVLRLSRVRARAARVICVENLTSFHALADLADPEMALLCLAGNPGPATRKLLRLLDGERPARQQILAWNDIDYGGLNILAQLRQRVSPEIGAWRMDRATLDAHARWARPLTAGDRRGLSRLAGRPLRLQRAVLRGSEM